jgi:hypothetical protein
MRRFPMFFLAGLFFSQAVFAADDAWLSLFDGKDFSGWDFYMMNRPDPAWDIPGLNRAADGTYLEALGKNRDPLNVFTITNLNGQPVIHISGQGFGVMMTGATFTNFHLRLQVKWGENRWSKKMNLPRDSGLLYFCHGEPGDVDKTWPRSLEFQIQEKDFGDLYALGCAVSVPARAEKVNDKTLYFYDPKSALTTFIQKRPVGNRCIKLVDAEKPRGEWNTLDLFCFDGDSIHIVNGRVVMRLHHAQRLDGAEPAPLTAGAISLQTEGAEVFYRNVEIQPIEKFPAEFAEP